MVGGGIRVVDADQHYYEQYDCFTRHIEAKYRPLAVHVVKNSRGVGEVYQAGRRLDFLRVIPTDVIYAAGSRLEHFASLGKETAATSGLWDFAAGRTRIEPEEVPGWVTSRSERVAILDSQGVEAAIMLPTLAVCVEHEIRHDVAAMYANFRAFNRWVAEEWGFGADRRIFSPAILSLVDLDLAVAELERVLGDGARLINLRPGPVYGRSPADPYFDPFWARVQESGTLVTLHSGDSGYTELVATHWGETPAPYVAKLSMFSHYIAFIERPIVDTIAAFVLHNLFGRFPGLRVLSIESGSAWLPGLLRQLDHAWFLGGRSPDNLGGPLVDAPSEIIRRHLFVSPFVEEELDEVLAAVGPERVIMGSDYPHPEGNAKPLDFLDKLTGQPADVVGKVMGGNLGSLLGLMDPA